MSRSYKKTPILKDRSPLYRRFAKRCANHRVRQSEIVTNGRFYRRIYNPWDIYDHISRESFASAMRCFESPHRYSPGKTLFDAVYMWKKWYYWK